MGYPVREYIRGFWYHIYSKGQRDEPLFFSPEDRIRYLSYLDDELDRCGGNIGSFCLMTNHSHLLLRMGPTPLGTVLRTAHSQYARDFNNRRGISGHLTQKRPGVKIVLDDSYITTLVRYIHQNPVDAGITETVKEYPWSSWPWFMNSTCEWIELSSWHYPPGFQGEQAKASFRDAIKENDVDLPGGEQFIGTGKEWDEFRERRQDGREGQRYRERRGRRSKSEILGSISKSEDFSADQLRGRKRGRDLSKARQQAMSIMYEEGHSVSDIARFFNRTPGAVTQAHTKWCEGEDGE